MQRNDPDPVLTLACRYCGRKFSSAMQMDPETFENIRVSRMFEACMGCGRVARYEKVDYTFRSD